MFTQRYRALTEAEPRLHSRLHPQGEEKSEAMFGWREPARFLTVLKEEAELSEVRRVHPPQRR